MAHIQRRKKSDGSWSYRAVVHKDGQWISSKSVSTRELAKRLGRHLDIHVEEKGLPKTRAQLRKHTVRDVILRYLVEKGFAEADNYALKDDLEDKEVSFATRIYAFTARDICNKTLADISKRDVNRYVEERLKETWKP